MNGKELMKKCEAIGWRLDRVDGSHHIMLHPNYPYHLTIPIHGSKDLKTGTLRALMKKAGLR